MSTLEIEFEFVVNRVTREIKQKYDPLTLEFLDGEVCEVQFNSVVPDKGSADYQASLPFGRIRIGNVTPEDAAEFWLRRKFIVSLQPSDGLSKDVL